jgi:hypothetical protein
MAYIEFIITSVTTANKTLATTATGAIAFYGTLKGTLGYWIRMPMAAAPIGEMSASAGVDGYGALWGYCTTAPLTFDATYTALTISQYIRGDRWFRISASSAKLAANAKQRKIKVWYRGINEGVDPST